MKDVLLVKTRLDNLKNEVVPQTTEATLLHKAKIELVSWIYNNGNVRDDKELINKQQTIEEERLALLFANETGLKVTLAEAKLAELKGLN